MTFEPQPEKRATPLNRLIPFIGDERTSTSLLVLALLSFVVCIAVYNAAPGLNDEIWVDEAFTLTNYADDTMWRPFTKYLNPNNHVLFSSLLSGWRKLSSNNLDIQWLRSLPLMLFVLAVPATFFAGRRLNGYCCAFVASLMFASGTITANFATQLRGYAPSWLPFAIVLWSALNINGSNMVRWRAIYVLAAIAAIAILPSNFFLVLIVACAVAAYHIVSGMEKNRQNFAGLGILLASPMLGLLTYVLVWHKLLAAAATDFSGWTRNILYGQWVISTLSDFKLMLIVPFAGICIALYSVGSRNRTAHKMMSARLSFAIVISLGLIALIILLPAPPFPRTFVPLLPVWYCIFGMFASVALQAFSTRWQRVAGIAIGVVAVVASAYGMRHQPCGGIEVKNAEVDRMDLCYQYFRHDYRPSRVLEVLLQLQSQSLRAVIAHYEGMAAVQILADGRVSIMHYRKDFLPIRKTMGSVLEPIDLPIMIVNSAAQFQDWCKLLDLDPRVYRLVEDTGFFKVYAGPG